MNFINGSLFAITLKDIPSFLTKWVLPHTVFVHFCNNRLKALVEETSTSKDINLGPLVRQFSKTFLKSCFEITLDVRHICDVLRNLVPFIQHKKRVKHPQKCVTFIKVAG